MTKIDMSFTEDEFRLLIKLLYTGYFVCDKDLGSDPDKDTKELLINRFLQSAHAFKVMDGIEYENKTDSYFIDSDQEEILLEDYNDFIEHTFWDELIFRLGRRDFVHEVGETTINKMDDKERIIEEEKYRDKYRKEFETNGIDRMRIIK